MITYDYSKYLFKIFKIQKKNSINILFNNNKYNG